MTNREKLIELLYNLPTPEFVIGTRRAGKKLITAGFIADHLIANGVTVREWISVKDRLPNKPMKCLVYTKRGDCCGYDILYYNQGFYSQYDNVTHWMPLPEPPEVGRND